MLTMEQDVRLVKVLDISRREKNTLTLAGIVSSSRQAALTIDCSAQCSAFIIFACAALGNLCDNPMTVEARRVGVRGLSQHWVDSHRERASRIPGSGTWGTPGSIEAGMGNSRPALHTGRVGEDVSPAPVWPSDCLPFRFLLQFWSCIS